MLDDDDEVRDRAAFNHYILSSGDQKLVQAYILHDELQLNVVALERALLAYTTAEASAGTTEQPFDLASIPVEEPQSHVAAAGLSSQSAAAFFDAGASGGKGKIFLILNQFKFKCNSMVVKEGLGSRQTMQVPAAVGKCKAWVH